MRGCGWCGYEDPLLAAQAFAASLERTGLEGAGKRVAGAKSRNAERAQVIVIDDEVDMKTLRKIYRAADAFVLPSHGEGWGLPLMEVLTTNPSHDPPLHAHGSADVTKMRSGNLY